MTSHHETIAGLDGSGWLASLADTFDPQRRGTVVVPDPLDPPNAGTRRRLGRRRAAWRLFEDKTIIDTLWDRLGVPRPPCIVTDSAEELSQLGPLVDAGPGVVCAVQQTGSMPSGGAEGIWWWRAGTPPALPVGPQQRLKLMPLMPGIAVRLHGMVLASGAVTFPPMEIIALPRLDRGTFLCCGTASTLRADPSLEELTRRIGTGLHDLLDYQGGLSVDGIMSDDGFRPTDLNTRLTSAMEAAPSDVRIQMQAANVLARESVDLDHGWLTRLAELAFVRPTLTIYGAANRVTAGVCCDLAVRWDSGRLVPAGDSEPDGHLRIAESLRGWTLVAELHAERVPSAPCFAPFAPEVFRLSDQVFGTDFGELGPPFGVGHANVPNPRYGS